MTTLCALEEVKRLLVEPRLEIYISLIPRFSPCTNCKRQKAGWDLRMRLHIYIELYIWCLSDVQFSGVYKIFCFAGKVLVACAIWLTDTLFAWKKSPHSRTKSTSTETIDHLWRATRSPDLPFLTDMTFAENRKRYVFLCQRPLCISHRSDSFLARLPPLINGSS